MVEDASSRAAPPPIKPAGRPKSFSCPNCGGTVSVKAVGHSINAVCQYCSSVIDLTNDNFRLLKIAHERTRPTLLNIGSRGALAGIQWEVVGYVQKTDESGMYPWDEYLLYSPYHGFRFLTQSRGHWSLFKVLKRAIADPGIAKEIKLDGKKYSKFLKGQAKVAYVKGEFYWRVKVDETERVADYIAPPYLLSFAGTEEELNVALGEYVPAKIVAKAFSISENMPYQAGVAANQPPKYPEGHIGKIWLAAIAFMLLATVLQVGSTMGREVNKYIFRQSWEVQALEKDKTITTDAFKLPGRSNLEITSTSPLNNDWLELDITVVDAKEEVVSELKQAIEFYSGSDYDGYWSEGSLYAKSLVSVLPKGDYKLLIDTDAGALQAGRPITFAIEIKRNVPIWSNYWLTLLLIIIYPAYATFRHRSFEFLRWSESDAVNKFLQ